MIDERLLEILCCPETKQPVTPIDEATIGRINERIEAKGVNNRSGNAVDETIDGGLVRQDRLFFYPVRDDIPIMLIDEAIAFDSFSANDTQAEQA